MGIKLYVGELYEIYLDLVKKFIGDTNVYVGSNLNSYHFGYVFYDDINRTINGEKITTELRYRMHYLTNSAKNLRKYELSEADFGDEFIKDLKEQIKNVDEVIPYFDDRYSYGNTIKSNTIMLSMITSKAFNKPINYAKIMNHFSGKFSVEAYESTYAYLGLLDSIKFPETMYNTITKIDEFNVVFKEMFTDLINYKFEPHNLQDFNIDCDQEELSNCITFGYGLIRMVYGDIEEDKALELLEVYYENFILNLINAVKSNAKGNLTWSALPLFRYRKTFTDKDEMLLEDFSGKVIEFALSKTIEQILSVNNSFKTVQTIAESRLVVLKRVTGNRWYHENPNADVTKEIRVNVKSNYGQQLDDKIIKILNRNKNNDKISTVINRFVEIFGDIISWDTLDDDLIKRVFPKNTEIGSLTLNSGEEEIVERGIYEDQCNYFFRRASERGIGAVLMLINSLDTESFKKELSHLAPSFVSFISNNVTSTGNAGNEARISYFLINSDTNEFFNEDNLVLLLNRVFKLVQEDGRSVMYKKFLYFCKMNSLDKLESKIEGISIDKKYKKLRMEISFN